VKPPEQRPQAAALARLGEVVDRQRAHRVEAEGEHRRHDGEHRPSVVPIVALALDQTLHIVALLLLALVL
jgi:hypothetical protein